MKEFYIDNCCTWRKKLQQVFGPHLLVYLDIFHAVKRVSEKIPKRHTLRSPCMQEFKMVFRDPTDVGPERTKPTPNVQVLKNNLDSFIHRWKDAAFNGVKVLSAAALSELNKLRKHMEKGCLSGIKPGRGTNRNEGLHKNLNKIMGSSRYGVELSYALLTECFYQNNERIQAKVESRCEFPIEQHSTILESLPDSGESFGLAFSSPHPIQAAGTGSTTLPKLDWKSNSYADFVKRITDTSYPQRTINSQMDYDSNDDDVISPPCEPLSGDENSGDEGTTTIPISTVKKILLRALQMLFAHKHLSSCAETAQLKAHDLPFMNLIVSNLNPCDFSTTAHTFDASVHEQRLQNVLGSWNFKRIPVTGDGNCLFYAIAFSLLQLMQTGALPSHVVQILHIVQDMTINQLAKQLRTAVVGEWLGENSAHYESFLTHSQLQQEAQMFTESGHFSGELGDLVLSALANLLHTPIVVQPVIVYLLMQYKILRGIDVACYVNHLFLSAVLIYGIVYLTVLSVFPQPLHLNARPFIFAYCNNLFTSLVPTPPYHEVLWALA